MAYLSWLSWHLSLVFGGAIVFGVLSSSLFREWPKKAVFKVREEYDVLSGGFRALTEGVRELKLHRERSEAFMVQSLANQRAQLLYYLVIGVILYVFLVWQVIDQHVIGGYALVFLFMMSPLTILTTSLPDFVVGFIARPAQTLGIIGCLFGRPAFLRIRRVGGGSRSRIQASILYRAAACLESPRQNNIGHQSRRPYFYMADRYIKLEEGLIAAVESR